MWCVGGLGGRPHVLGSAEGLMGAGIPCDAGGAVARPDGR